MVCKSIHFFNNEFHDMPNDFKANKICIFMIAYYAFCAIFPYEFIDCARGAKIQLLELSQYRYVLLINICCLY